MIHPLGSMDGVELAFTQPQPTDTRLYRELADAGSLRFEAPFDGIVFPQSLLEAPMPDSNAKLHRVLRKEAERALAEYTSNGSLSDRVRVAIRARLSSGNVTAEQVCKSLFMGKRTLVRHLEEEGTTFGTLLDESRRALAEHYLCSTELSVERIAGLLGYSRTASFSRAFRRWSDRTPLRFRRDSQAQA